MKLPESVNSSTPNRFQRILAGNPAQELLLYQDEVNGLGAFLDLHPIVEGHTLVVPQEPVERVENLVPFRSQQLSALTQIVSRRISVVLQPLRVIEIVSGYQFPHAHRMLVPSYEAGDVFSHLDDRLEPTPDALLTMYERLVFSDRTQEKISTYLHILGTHALSDQQHFPAIS